MRTFRIAIAIRRPMDVAAYAALLNGMRGLRVVVADADLAACVELCRKADADVALLDAAYSRFSAFKAAQTLLTLGVIRCAAFLDDQFAIVRAARAIELRNCIYLTRQNDLEPILFEIGDQLNSSMDFTGRAVISTGPSEVHLAQSLEELRQLDHAGFLSLTSRERQIVQRMALGMSVKQMAEQLGVAVSTVDNHKTRLMKKLKLHKHPQIATAALQAGLMDCP
jgi:DNA-binding NarL/FixJ family response regulator